MQTLPRPWVKTSKNVSKNAENAWVDPVSCRDSKQQIMHQRGPGTELAGLLAVNSACAYQTNDLSSFLMRTLSLVQINLHGCWPRM